MKSIVEKVNTSLSIGDRVDSDGDIEVTIQVGDNGTSFWINEEQAMKIINHLSHVFIGGAVGEEVKNEKG